MNKENYSVKLENSDYLSLALFFILSFFLFADQNLMGPNLTQIANDFNFNERCNEKRKLDRNRKTSK